MQKTKILSANPIINTIENVNALDRGKNISDLSIDTIICDPPLFKNLNDRELNNWTSETTYIEWFRVFMMLVSRKLKKTGTFFLIGDIEDIHHLIPIIKEFKFELTITYYIKNNRKSHKKLKDAVKTNKIMDTIFVFTRNFQNKVKKILKLKQQETGLSSKEINLKLSGNPNGGGYWSIYTGNNSKNEIPSEEHWRILRGIFNIEIEYCDINGQFRQFDGNNLWEDIVFEEDKMLTGLNRPIMLYDRIIKMNRKDPSELTIWDPFCGYGNSTIACKNIGCNFYASEFDINVYFKAMINTGNTTNFTKPVSIPKLLKD